MEGQQESINITELPDGALDAILSELYASDRISSFLYFAYFGQERMECEKEWIWKDVINFRLVNKSFRRAADLFVPSFALYQQLFNKGVDPSVWITEQEEDLATKSNCLISKFNFLVKGIDCDLIQLPDLSSMPLVALESTINIAIHQLLVSHASLANIINIIYAFPSNNAVGFLLTLPGSSLYPGKQFTFQVTNLSGNGGHDSYHQCHQTIVVKVADSVLAQVLGIAPNKANLVLFNNIHYQNGEADGKDFTNFAFFQSLSNIMPVYSALDWIRNLLQIGTAIEQELPFSPEDPEVNYEEVLERYNNYDSNVRTIFDHQLPSYTNKQQKSLLCQLPLLPGIVVKQILSPNNKSLLQLIMMNKLVQFYRLNKLHKQTMLTKMLNEHSNTCHQEAITKLFNYITFIQHYTLQDPDLHPTLGFFISFGAANPEFHGCYLVVKYEHQNLNVDVEATESQKEKIQLIFGPKRYFDDRYHAPTFQLALLHTQKLLALPVIMPPIVVLNLFSTLVSKIGCNNKKSYNKEKKTQPVEVEGVFDLLEVDPSCQIDGLKVHEDHGEHFTSLLINRSTESCYSVLQLLRSPDKLQYFLHIRFGYTPTLFSVENATSELHFVITLAMEFDQAKLNYNYWISLLTKGPISHGNSTEELNLREVPEAYIFAQLLTEQDTALAYEIWHAEQLKAILSSLKAQIGIDKTVIDQINQLEQRLPANIKVKCCKAKMLAHSEGCYTAIKYLNKFLKQSPFNGQLALTKAKILENAGHLKQAIRAYTHIIDFPFEKYIEYTENSLLLKACQNLFQLFQKCKMWHGALQIWQIFYPNRLQLLITGSNAATEIMRLLHAEQYIREEKREHHLKTGLNLLAKLPASLKKEMLIIEAYHLLDQKNSPSLLKRLDRILQVRANFDSMVHKAVILHDLLKYEEAVECYTNALVMPDRYEIFDLEASREAANNKQHIPWPFRMQRNSNKVWTDEEILMLFVLHPNAVKSAQTEKPKSQTQNEAIQFLLKEVDTAEQHIEAQKECLADLYPVEYLFSKLIKSNSLKYLDSAIPTSPSFTAELHNALGRGNTVPFLWQLQTKSNDSMTLLWYPTHPCAIPFLLMHGISPDENGVNFHTELSSCGKHYNNNDHSISLSVDFQHSSDNYFSMALLVEVDSAAAKQNTIHKEARNQKVDWNLLPMVTIQDKAHIGAICYIAIITDRYWDNKVCLVGRKNM